MKQEAVGKIHEFIPVNIKLERLNECIERVQRETDSIIGLCKISASDSKNFQDEIQDQLNDLKDKNEQLIK